MVDDERSSRWHFAIWHQTMSFAAAQVIARPAITLALVAFGSLSLVSCNPLRGLPESDFQIAKESRLPQWFELPVGYSRDDVTVLLTYYAPPVPAVVDDVVLELEDRNGKVLSKVTGKSRWHPETEKKQNEFGGLAPGSYPHFIIVTVRGISEVIEHRRPEPTFYVTDDPRLRSEAESGS